MNAISVLPVNTETLTDLCNFLRDTASELSLADVTALAIRAWLADQSTPPRIADPGYFGSASAPATGAGTAIQSGTRGYQWKELFVPDGTEVRMHFDGETYHARVDGDAIVYKGRRVSPRQFTMAIAGDGRNAWRDLALRLPGEKHYRPASLMRRNLQAKYKAQAGVAGVAGVAAAAGHESPVATMAAAAAAMSEALRTALALVEHTNAHSVSKYERRVANNRRAIDILTDHVRFD